MRGWYNIHDHENKRMGFVPFIGSGKSAPTVATTTPSVVMPGVTSGLDRETLLAIAIIVGIAAAVTATVVLLIVYCYQVVQLAAKAKKSSTKSSVSEGGSTLGDPESAVALIIL